MYLFNPYDFKGTISAVGGAGSPPGGPGTIYIEIQDGAVIKRILKIDGVNRGESTQLRVILDENGGYYEPFDIIKLTRQAAMSVKGVNIIDIIL